MDNDYIGSLAFMPSEGKIGVASEVDYGTQASKCAGDVIYSLCTIVGQNRQTSFNFQ